MWAPQRKEKHVVDLIKIVKKIVGSQRGQKFTPLVNRSNVSTKGQKNKNKKACSFLAQTFF